MIINDLTLQDEVMWDKEIYSNILSHMVEKYGQGPFKIMGLKLWGEPGKLPEGIAPYTVTIVARNGTLVDIAGEHFMRANKDTGTTTRRDVH